ncbi:MAG TPA: YfhO family protein, partial [Thermoanaerobaculia bacterium]|nr:YfhO family protein [Thermoanaerobaculia bacterium]
QLVPGFDHARDSIRSEGFHWQVASNWSTPAARFFELLFPRVYRAFVGPDGNQAIRSMYPYRIDPFVSDIYIGGLAIILAIAGIFAGVRGRAFVLTLFAGFTILALGDGTPVFRFLYEAKIFASIRYPEKFLLGALFVLIVWAAMVLDRLLAGDEKVRRIAMRLTIVWAAVAVITWLIGTRIPSPTAPDHVPLPWVQYWLLNLARAIAVWLLLKFVAPKKIWIAALFAFVVVELAWLHTSVADRAPRSFFDEPELARNLPAHRDDYRIFHQASWDEWEGMPDLNEFLRAGSPDKLFRDGMYPFRPAAFGFRGALEDDLDQTALMTSTLYLRAAQRVRQHTRSWHSFFLDSANVEQILEFVGGSMSVRATGSHPRYYFASRVIQIASDDELVQNVISDNALTGDAFTPIASFTPATARVTHVEEHPSHVRIEVDADGDAFLVAAITAHRYWHATLDGKAIDIAPANIAFQGVRVPRGKHVVEWRYRNPLIMPSGLFSAAVVLLLIAMAAIPRRGTPSPSTTKAR